MVQGVFFGAQRRHEQACSLKQEAVERKGQKRERELKAAARMGRGGWEKATGLIAQVLLRSAEHWLHREAFTHPPHSLHPSSEANCTIGCFAKCVWCPRASPRKAGSFLTSKALLILVPLYSTFGVTSWVAALCEAMWAWVPLGEDPLGVGEVGWGPHTGKCRATVQYDVVLYLIQTWGTLKTSWREFPGGPVVKALCFHCRAHQFNAWSRN